MARVTTNPWANAPAIALVGAKAHEEVAAVAQSLHHPGVRDAHRALLLTAKAAFEAALGAALGAALESGGITNETEGGISDEPENEPWVATCRESLLRVYRAFAEDARYGAGQLSRAAQRAPSEADCEDGWERVEEIARGAEAVASKAQALLRDGDSAALRKLAADTRRASDAAREVIDGRNPAYTFHANPAFSFGEGWYAAAAAVLGGASLQIEPGQKHSAAAERFLVGAGLAAQLQPYRPRPRANKALPLIVADAFRQDAQTSQARLRSAFLEDTEVVPRVHAWLQARLPGVVERPTVLVWNRQCRHDAHRNSAPDELAALCRMSDEAGLCPVAIGDGLGEVRLPSGTLDLTLFWKEPLFQGVDMRRAQLELFERLRSNWALVGQVGVTTAGMDGPALLGLPTLYITDQPNVRLGRWVSAVPGYEEVIRDGTHVERIRTRLMEWAQPLARVVG